jgi:hypothetical protein
VPVLGTTWDEGGCGSGPSPPSAMSDALLELLIGDKFAKFARKFADRTEVLIRQCRSPTHRSRLTNGKDLLPDLDGRSAMARRFKDIIGQIITDQGGLGRCSESRLQLVRRFSAACVLAERLESRIANGQDVNISEHALLCSTLHRLAGRIGINRRPKPIPSPLDYARAVDRRDDDRLDDDEVDP